MECKRYAASTKLILSETKTRAMNNRITPVLVLFLVTAVIVTPALATVFQKTTGMSQKFTPAGIKSPSYKPFNLYLKDRQNLTTPVPSKTPTPTATPVRSTAIYYRVGPLGTGVAPDPSTDMRIILQMPMTSILVEEAVAVMPDGRSVTFPRGSMLDRSGKLHYPFSEQTVTITGKPFVFKEGIPAKYLAFPSQSFPTTTPSSQQPWTYGSSQGYNFSNWLSPLSSKSWELPLLLPVPGVPTGGIFG